MGGGGGGAAPCPPVEPLCRYYGNTTFTFVYWISSLVWVGCRGDTSSVLLGGDASSVLLGGDASSVLLGGDASSVLLGGDASSVLLGGDASSMLLEITLLTHLTAQYKPKLK